MTITALLFTSLLLIVVLVSVWITESEPRPTVPQNQYVSQTHTNQLQHPLYFRMVFGVDSNESMLGAVDESGGIGTGYDVAYVDENGNHDLSDDKAKRFTRIESGRDAGTFVPEFELMGPYNGAEKANYRINLYTPTHRGLNGLPENEAFFQWWVDINDWNYFFINGKAMFYATQDAALTGNPIYLLGPCRWDISSRVKKGKVMLSAGLKDKNNCTLRGARHGNKAVLPVLTLLKDGIIKVEETLEYG